MKQITQQLEILLIFRKEKLLVGPFSTTSRATLARKSAFPQQSFYLQNLYVIGHTTVEKVNVLIIRILCQKFFLCQKGKNFQQVLSVPLLEQHWLENRLFLSTFRKTLTDVGTDAKSRTLVNGERRSVPRNAVKKNVTGFFGPQARD